MKENIGYFLYMRRVAKGISLEHIANALGVTIEEVARWENGSVKPDEHTLLRLNDVLETEVFTPETTDNTVQETEDPMSKPSPSSVKKAVITACSIIGALVLCIFALVIANRQHELQFIKETDEYITAYRYLKNSDTYEKYNDAKIKLEDYYIDFSNSEMTFSVGGDKITVTCHEYDGVWEACEQCSKLNVTEKTTVSDYSRKYRTKYNRGACKRLRGEIPVVVFYMDDFESRWTADEMKSYAETEINPALDALEREAQKYGVSLSLEIKDACSLYYDGKIIKDPENGCTSDTLQSAARDFRFHKDKLFVESLKTKHGSQDIICLLAFNKDGIGCTFMNVDVDDEQNGIEEHITLFTHPLGSKASSLEEAEEGYMAMRIMRSILYAYGAENLRTGSEFKKDFSLEHYINDIMLRYGLSVEDATVDEVTAFSVGWTNEVPTVMQDERWEEK